VTGIGAGETRQLRDHSLTVYQQHYNSAWLAAPDRTLLGRHDKQYLVPVTERIPYHEVFGFLLPFMKKQFGRFVPAERLTLLELPVGGPAGLVRGPDLLRVPVPRLVRRMRATAPSSSSTSPTTRGSGGRIFRSCTRASARCAQSRTGAPSSVAPNTGISAVYDPLGRVGFRTGLFRQAQFTATIPLVRSGTWYARTGDLLLYLSYLAVAALLTLAWLRHRRSRSVP